MSLSLSVQVATRRKVPGRAQVRRWVSAALTVIEVTEAQLSVRFVDEPEARILNHEFRHRDYATNVLTFPYPELGAACADIIICSAVVASEARDQKKALMHHYAHLVVHGVLHAAGFDHDNEADAARMETIEARILARFRIENPYV